MEALLDQVIITPSAVIPRPKFRLLNTVAIGTVAAKCISGCFTSAGFEHRNDEFDKLSPPILPAHTVGSVSIYEPLQNRLTARDMAAAVLSLPPDTPRWVLAKELIQRGHAPWLQAFEKIVHVHRRTQEGIGLTNLNRGNFGFVRTENAYVCVCKLMCDGGCWYAHHHPLGEDNRNLDYGWGKADRLIVPNLEHPVLCI